jgi:hypothetical protein
MWIYDKIPHAIQALVARPIGNDQQSFIQNTDEPWHVSLGRNVTTAIPVGSRHQKKRRTRDEAGAMIVHKATVLFHDPVDRPSDEVAKLLFSCDYVFEFVHNANPRLISKTPLPNFSPAVHFGF